jgi:uncharacterized protein YbjT (DUF2867 family)
MPDHTPYLRTGVGSGYTSISRLVAELLTGRGEPVRAMVRHDEGRAEARRAPTALTITPMKEST